MISDSGYQTYSDESPERQKARRYPVMAKYPKQRPLIAAAVLSLLVLLGAATTTWLSLKAVTARDELRHAALLLPEIKEDALRADAAAAAQNVDALERHTANARAATTGRVWRLASALPWVGNNLQAVTEVAITADDIARLGARPLVGVLQSLDWKTLTPTGGGVDVDPLVGAAPTIALAASAVQQSTERLNNIDSSKLLPHIARPLEHAREQLESLGTGLQTAADFATLTPAMLGAQQPRHYLLLVENNAESRATGGIPGALAILSVEEGHLALSSQTSAAQIGVFSPPVELAPEQQQIYSARLGKYMQDVNLTPDFPTAARTAQAMWEREFGQRVDGVISIDPVALSYILHATGPVRLTDPLMSAKVENSLPLELTGRNVVETLLSDVYKKIAQPELQDAYFAGVAKEIFATLTSDGGDSTLLIDGVARAATERRVKLWSATPEEQRVLERYPVGGSISGASVAPAEFGIYFNDGTGAKMDFYVKRTVQLIEECPHNGYERTTVRVISTNTVPADAAQVLPRYVTGDGTYGVPVGSVQTNIVTYGPVQAVVETAMLDGQYVGFAPHVHADRPVGVIAMQLAPGETRTVDMTFGKIVQHTEPNIVVTPTVQDVNDVLLPAESASCG